MARKIIDSERVRDQIRKLKEMLQFGPGVTFEDQMGHFLSLGDSVAQIWPWVEFSPNGNLLCSVMPIHREKGYHLVLVDALDDVRFPGDESLGFVAKETRMEIFVVSGQVEIQRPDKTTVITEHEVGIIEEAELCALLYKKGTIAVFKQTPTIADASKFSFHSLQ